MNANEGSSYSSSAGKVASPLQKQHSAETRCRSSTLQHHAESHSTGRGCCCQRCAKRVELNASEGSSCSSAGEVVSPLQKQHRADKCRRSSTVQHSVPRCRSSTVQTAAAEAAPCSTVQQKIVVSLRCGISVPVFSSSRQSVGPFSQNPACVLFSDS